MKYITYRQNISYLLNKNLIDITKNIKIFDCKDDDGHDDDDLMHCVNASNDEY